MQKKKLWWQVSSLAMFPIHCVQLGNNHNSLFCRMEILLCLCPSLIQWTCFLIELIPVRNQSFLTIPGWIPILEPLLVMVVKDWFQTGQTFCPHLPLNNLPQHPPMQLKTCTTTGDHQHNRYGNQCCQPFFWNYGAPIWIILILECKFAFSATSLRHQRAQLEQPSRIQKANAASHEHFA